MKEYPSDMQMQLVPTVVEQTHRGERGWDVFSRLLEDRIVFIGSEITRSVSNLVIAELLFLDAQRALREAHRADRRQDRARHRPRHLLVVAGSARLLLDR